MAKIVQNSDKSLFECAMELRAGKLVSFPTETVYGLGASLWNEEAVLNIFRAKERPITDPLIVHVGNILECEKLISLNKFQRNCFNILTKEFWPGPLTLVLTASKIVPKSVMANGTYVGIRIPAHEIAQKFLRICSVPVAAPSANKFGHVSPTSEKHVFDDLKNVDDLFIIEKNENCKIGIESTVLKIQEDGKIKLLRPGSICISQIEKLLQENEVSYILEEQKKYVSRETFKKETIHLEENTKMFHVKHFEHDKNVSRETFLVGDESPGQNLTHYSPWIETHLLINDQKNISSEFPIQSLQKISLRELERATILDFGKKFAHLKQDVLHYADLSETGNYTEAAHNLFHMLRESEKIQNANAIFLTQFSPNSEIGIALFDRIYRSASGKFVFL